MLTLTLLRGHALARAASQRQTLEQEQRSETVAMEIIVWGKRLSVSERLEEECGSCAHQQHAAGHVHPDDRAARRKRDRVAAGQAIDRGFASF